MGADYLLRPLVFLVDTVFSLYLFAILLRFLLQWVNADYTNPISRFLVKLTHPPLRVLRRFIPAFGRVDTASLVLLFGVELVRVAAVAGLGGQSFALPALAVASIAQLLEMVLDFYFFAILIRALLSWFGPAHYHPVAALLYALTEPLLAASRRLLPPMGGLDLSPLIPLLGIQVAKMLLLPPLQQLIGVLG